MISEEDFSAVRDCPPDLGFARLEKKLRDRLDNNLEHSQSNESWAHYVIEYMSPTMAAAQELGLDFLDLFSLPDENNTSDLQGVYNAFRRAVDMHTIRIHIRNSQLGPSNLFPSTRTRKSISAPT